MHASPVLREAVEQTRGLIITYKKKPIMAMFDCCCGGIIPAHLTGVDFTAAPYLKREKRCTFCESCKIYTWALDVPIHEFKALLNEVHTKISSIDEIAITKKDKAGKVGEVSVRGAHGVQSITGKELYALITKIKSYCYTIEKKAQKIIISGRGYGHHLGICQWGARNMVAQGWDYKSILLFYYPHTTIMKFKNSVKKP